MEYILRIDGMSCGHCRMAVEKALRNVPGVESVIVNLEEKQAKIVGNVNKKLLIQTIEDAGYLVVD